MGEVDAKLHELGITLPHPAAPVANYVGFTVNGNVVVVSGQLPLGPDGKLAPDHAGKVGGAVPAEVATSAARLCAINVLAQLKAAIGDLDRVTAVLRLGGFINAEPDYTAHAGVMNGASDLVVEVLGAAGRHARSTIGVAGLPLGACVEVEGMFAFE